MSGQNPDLETLSKEALKSLAASLGIATKWAREQKLKDSIREVWASESPSGDAISDSSKTLRASDETISDQDFKSLFEEPGRTPEVSDVSEVSDLSEKVESSPASLVRTVSDPFEDTVSEGSLKMDVRGQALSSKAESYALSVPPNRFRPKPEPQKNVCPICSGFGSLETGRTHMGLPIMEPCKCVLIKSIYRNLERGWSGLATAQRIPSSPLMDYVRQDLYITANDETLRSHLKYVGIRMDVNWSFQVVSDADLMTAWLANVALSGKDIYDFDVSSAAGRSLEKFTLLDLVEPPGLLIIRLGVKIARNSAMSEVFLEALTLRDHVNRPTWVVDQPGNRINQISDILHRCYSPESVSFLQRWDHLVLDEANLGLKLDMVHGSTHGSTHGETPQGSLKTPPQSHQNLSQSFSLSGVLNANSGSTQTTEVPTEDIKRKKKWGGV